MDYKEYYQLYESGPAAPRKDRLHLWELCLLISLCLALVAGTWAQGKQQELSSKLLRLHVLAVDDSDREQAIKLDVRDAVLGYISPHLTDAGSSTEAAGIIRAHMPEIKTAAEAAAQGRKVTVSLGEELYPSKGYEGFRLPAGRYQSLRISLGEGRGQNWWCIVFPPVCLSAVQAEEMEKELGAEDLRLISEDGPQLRFKTLELWGQFLNWLG